MPYAMVFTDHASCFVAGITGFDTGQGIMKSPTNLACSSNTSNPLTSWQVTARFFGQH